MRRLLDWVEAIRSLRTIYSGSHGRKLKLFRPRRFTEKMQWRKLFDRNTAFTLFCDKMASRDWIAERVGAQYLVPIYWSGDAAEKIPFDTLAPPYVLKSTHASGQVIMVTEENGSDWAALKARAAEWLQIDFSVINSEPGYKDLPRHLLVEHMLFGENGGLPEEWRVFVFNGKAAVINTVYVEAGILRNGAFHTPAWERLDWYFTRRVDRDFPAPRRLPEVIRVAERLGAGIDHIRVDFYGCGNRIFVGELTAYSWSGMARFNIDEADLALGRFWRLRWPLWRALARILFSAR